MTALATAPVVEEIKLEAYHGVPVLRLHVDDPIPTPRAPQRNAVRIFPDLARYMLTFNHPQNRKPKKTAIARYARDMELGYWAFTPESIVFSATPLLEDGQNRLHAVIEAGVPAWMMVDFGWPTDLIEVINRASSRTNADAFMVAAVPNRNSAAAAIGIVEKYKATAGTPLHWAIRVLSPTEALEIYRQDSAAWDRANAWANRIYNATQGLGTATWAAAYYLIAGAAGQEKADAFFTEVVDETGEAGSASRRLKSHYLRRKLYDTASGDRREPLENIVRAFNAWLTKKPVGFVRTGGSFIVTPVRSR